jgi:VIT1/CCC1 family predicted Fe2+/Mn2+ transporter
VARRRTYYPHHETHKSGRAGWLRAAVLGSNDAIVSTASLMVGVAATNAGKDAILVAGVAALAAGAMSMAIGEYVSVSSQADAERADTEKEKLELAEEPEMELLELAGIYRKRGLDPQLAMAVAKQLSAHDDLGAHLRDELGIDPSSRPRPWQAAWVSALSFASFAAVPVGITAVMPWDYRIVGLAVASLVCLAGLGALGARLGGAQPGRATLRVTLGGILAFAVTSAVGRLLTHVMG